MPTKPKTINGLVFEIEQPYTEGHSCTAAEAKALNQTRSENIGNNVRARLKEMIEGDAEKGVAPSSPDEIIAFVAGKDAEYVFTLANVGSSRKMDPYEREADKIAKELLKAHLANTGRKLTVAPEGVTEDEWNEKIEAEVERIATSDQVIKAAKKNVDAKRKQAESLVESVGGIAV